MRAAVLREGAIVVRDDVPDPAPGFGQVLVQVKACGICGSDLHFAQHGASMLATMQEMQGMPDLGIPPVDLSRDVFMGHEFSGEILDVGPGTEAPAPGTIVTSIPIMLTMEGVRDLVYSNVLPAGYSERMLLSAPMLQVVPNGLDAGRAALTEPMAVGLHAVNRSGIAAGEGAVVVGCGPVGLAVIAALATRNIEPIVAADLSPARRALAGVMGAHHVVDPANDSAFDTWSRVGGGRQLVVFEAVGVPGMIDDVLRMVPPHTRVLVVGVCMHRDTITPFFGIGKELDIRFALAYDPVEFETSLRSIAEGIIDVSPMITGEVNLDGVPGAFRDLADPEQHCKILVVP
jgi:threonine dehydrogenase-like Zn-dependent dehydrogenase